MSTSPDVTGRAEDRIVNAISRWLGRHLGTEELRSELDAIGLDDLAQGQAEAVRELLDELDRADPGTRPHLEAVARETLEAVALGGG